MDVYRVFDWDRHSLGNEPGGPLHVPRAKQGAGRHDIPERDGVFYASRSRVSAVAEAIQVFRNRTLSDDDFEIAGGKIQALAAFSTKDEIRLADLTDARTLVEYAVPPSQVATMDRAVTRRLSTQLFDRGLDGFLWWSSLEASWTNMTFFQSRAIPQLRLIAPILPLSLQLPDLINAAKSLRIRLG